MSLLGHSDLEILQLLIFLKRSSKLFSNRNPNKYELFALVVHQKPDVDFCPNIVKTFIPFNRLLLVIDHCRSHCY